MAARLVAVALAVAAGAGLSAATASPTSRPFSCDVSSATPTPPAGLPRYVLDVRVQKGLHLVTGTLRVTFTPEVATDRLVFRLWANSPYLAQKGARLTVSSVRWGGKAVRTARPNSTTLIVRHTVAAGLHATVFMKWRLRVPRGSFDRLRGGPIARLGSFFPLLAWDPRRGWQTDPPSSIGWETWTSPAADFSVRVKAPMGLRVLGSGSTSHQGRWSASGIRDFALAVGRFTVATGSSDGVRLTVAVHGKTRAYAESALDSVRSALEEHAARFGAYPWPALTVVVSDMGPYGWEYPNLVFVSSTSDDLALGIAHELGHQWFYSLVGNNQARDPWLDEAPATWAQVRFSRTLADELTRPIPDDVRNQLGRPMSFWDQFSIPEFI